MAGLIGVGRNTLSQASSGFQTVAGLETARNNMARQLNAARDSQRVSSVTTGAGLGASIGVTNLMKQRAAEEAGRQAVGAAAQTAAPQSALAALEGTKATPQLLLEAARADGAAKLAAMPIPGLTSTAAPVSAGLAQAGTAAGSLATPIATAGSLGTVATPAGALTLAAPTGAAAATGTAATGAAATGAAAGAGGAASTGALATIGAVATPLLIGAGAALLLDTMFDIF